MHFHPAIDTRPIYEQFNCWHIGITFTCYCTFAGKLVTKFPVNDVYKTPWLKRGLVQHQQSKVVHDDKQARFWA